MQQNEKKPRRRTRELLIASLAAGCTNAEAARRCGVSRSTVIRRLADPAFAAKVQECRVRLLDDSIGRLADALSVSVDTLRTIATTAESEHARTAAAAAILRHLLPLRECLDHETRLAALERSLCK